MVRLDKTVGVCIPRRLPDKSFSSTWLCAPGERKLTTFQRDFSVSDGLSFLDGFPSYLFLKLPKHNFYLWFLILYFKGIHKKWILFFFLIQKQPYVFESSHRVLQADGLVILRTPFEMGSQVFSALDRVIWLSTQSVITALRGQWALALANPMAKLVLCSSVLPLISASISKRNRRYCWPFLRIIFASGSFTVRADKQ